MSDLDWADDWISSGYYYADASSKYDTYTGELIEE